LLEHLGERLYLICIDGNEKMLSELCKNLQGRAKIIKASAECLPLSVNSLDCIFTFNAIHHFKFLSFLEEVARVLRTNGYLFVYTRLRSQNKKNIWGTHFPKFHEMERRLYELSEFKKIPKKIPSLELESIEYFKYERVASLEWLVTQAKEHHYSTFCLYEEKEFEEALEKFKRNVINHYRDTSRVVWNDENIMFVIKKTTRL
jgi:ubiquinone/menaquinone biosynthesis C-methylase UbiE